MIVSLFGDTQVRPGKEEQEARLVDRLEPILRGMPGFISSKYYTAEDGEVVGIIRFETRAQLESFVHEGNHGRMQASANEFYASFWVQSAEVYNEYLWQDGEKITYDMTSYFRERDRIEQERANATSMG